MVIGVPFEYEFNLVKGDRTTRTIEYLADGESVDLSDVIFSWWFRSRGAQVVASTSNGKITLTDEGYVSLVLDDSDAALLDGRGRHFLKIIHPFVRTLLEGEVIVYDPIG